MLHLVFSKLFHEAWIPLGGRSIAGVSLQLGFCPQFCAVSIFAEIEAFILKKDSCPQAGHLSLPKATLPHDTPGRFRWLKAEVALDDVLMVITVGILLPEKHRPNQ